MDVNERVRRPWGVTLVVAVTWVIALVDLAVGAASVWLSLNESRITVDLTVDELRLYGVVLLATGLLTAALALGLGAGSQLSRVVVLIIMLARIAAAVYAYVSLGDLVQWHALGQGGASLLVVIVLLTPRAFAFYRSS